MFISSRNIWGSSLGSCQLFVSGWFLSVCLIGTTIQISIFFFLVMSHAMFLGIKLRARVDMCLIPLLVASVRSSISWVHLNPVQACVYSLNQCLQGMYTGTGVNPRHDLWCCASSLQWTRLGRLRDRCRAGFCSYRCWAHIQYCCASLWWEDATGDPPGDLQTLNAPNLQQRMICCFYWIYLRFSCGSGCYWVCMYKAPLLIIKILLYI